MATAKAVRRNTGAEDAKPKIWTARICPYAERALFALNELQVQYENEEIDLIDKPAHFMVLPHEGKVPVIEDQGRVLYESLICLEYLDENWKSPSGKRLYPEKPIEKAVAKLIVHFLDTKVIPKYYPIIGSDSDEKRQQAYQEFVDALAKVDEKMRECSADGPFFMGKEVSFVDMAFIPHIRRFKVVERMFGFQIPSEYKRFHRWREACLALPSYKRITDDVTDEELYQRSKEYLKKKANK